MARAITYKTEHHQRKLMRKVTVHILLAAVLLGAVIPKSHAATGESGNNATATSPVDTLPPEPGTVSDTQNKAADNRTPPIGSSPVINSESSTNAETAGKDAAVVNRS
jgi:hypothetical protein